VSGVSPEVAARNGLTSGVPILTARSSREGIRERFWRLCLNVDAPWSCAHPPNGFLGFFAHYARTRAFRQGAIIPRPCHEKTCVHAKRRDAGSRVDRIARNWTCTARTIDNCHLARENPNSEERTSLDIGPRAASVAPGGAGVWPVPCQQTGETPMQPVGRHALGDRGASRENTLLVRLTGKPSHGHVLPVLALLLLVALVGRPDRPIRSDWWSAVAGCAGLVVVAAVAFYAGIPLIKMIRLTERYLDRLLSRPKAARVLIGFGALLTYFAFLCRIAMISAVEALFLAILLTAFTNNRLSLFEHPLRIPYWWYPLSILVTFAHAWAERRNLGRAGLIVSSEVR